ncbi:hypothetical protein B0H14DRAFT_2893318 [Mycena olivaceomarginata]|nr:hypothetical protein B0H14DRAFT_2893318 [Mycena olivaceomarginata]
MPSQSKVLRQSLTLAAQATALRRDIDAYTVNVDHKSLFTVLAELAELLNPGSFRFFDRLYYEEEATISKFLRHETGKRLKVGVMSTWTSRPVGRDRKEWQFADMHCWLLVILPASTGHKGKTYLIWDCNVEKSDFDKFSAHVRRPHCELVPRVTEFATSHSQQRNMCTSHTTVSPEACCEGVEGGQGGE